MLGPWRGRSAAAGIGAALSLAAGLVTLIGVQDLFGASRVVRADSFRPTSLGAHRPASPRAAGQDAKAADQPNRVGQSPQQPTSAPAPTLRGAITVDSTSAWQGPAGDARAVCGLSAAAPAASQGAGAEPVGWEQWCALTGTRLSAKSSADSLPVYAARIPSGTAILIANHSEGPAEFQLALRATRGVYTVERYCVDFPPDPASASAAGPAQDPAAANTADAAHVERLESVILGGKGTLRKPGRLPAGSLAVYRITNRSAQVQSAFDAAMQAMRALRAGHSGVYGRLMTPLSECADNVARLSDGIQPDERYGVLRYIHRALLTLAQAQALCRNFQSEGRLPEQRAAALGTALDGLEESLSELSGGCLGIVPGIVVGPPSADHPNTREVEVTVANTGSQSIAVVKIGAAAGKGCSVQPADLALFRELKPGEVAKARFTVTLPDDAAAHSVAADIAWLAAKVPARLKLRNL